MKNTKEFPFEKSRRITKTETKQAKKAIEHFTGKKRVRPVGRPVKKQADRLVAVSIRLHPNIIKWTKKQAKQKGIGYQSLINQILLSNCI